MRRIGIVVLVVALVAGVVAVAGARGWGYGQGYGMMAPQNQEVMAKFMQDTLALRQQLAAKNMEMRTLWIQPGADKAKLDALGKEIEDLRMQLSKKAAEAGLGNYGPRMRGPRFAGGPGACPGYGPGNGPGYGRGNGGCPGYGGAPGYGGGNPRGFRGGYQRGPGGCW
jgi:hypothetical protein